MEWANEDSGIPSVILVSNFEFCIGIKGLLVKSSVDTNT